MGNQRRDAPCIEGFFHVREPPSSISRSQTFTHAAPATASLQAAAVLKERTMTREHDFDLDYRPDSYWDFHVLIATHQTSLVVHWA